jgi:DNA-binding transcriptional regulator YiaG
MTPDEFKHARQDLGISVIDLARILDVEVRTIRKWESAGGSNARPPNPIAARVLSWLQDGFRPPEWSKTPTDATLDREA